MARFTHEIVQMDLESRSSIVLSATERPVDVVEGFDLARGVLVLIFDLAAEVL
jgi:hypothetical protein